MKRCLWLLFLVGLGPAFLCPLDLSAAPNASVSQIRTRSRTRGQFVVPDPMKHRVEFWIDIFTRYGKHQVVMHHRDYPHIVFDVVDLRPKQGKVSDAALEKLLKKEKKKREKEIIAALKLLAGGRPAKSALEKRIELEMKALPGGTSKYKKVYRDKLVRGQTGIRERYMDAMKRSGRYMHIIEDIFVNEFRLPIELTRLPFIESSFDYRAYSSVGAAGIWQFMSRTARYYKMKVDRYVDERRDIISATRGAAMYLRDAFDVLGNWPLALTSYNHGVGGIKRKIKKLGTKDITKIVEHPTKRVLGFASNNFYAEFLAALEVYDNRQIYFPGLEIESPRELGEIKMVHTMSSAYVTKKLGVNAETLKEYNTGLSSRIWKGIYNIPKGYALKVPPRYVQYASLLRKPEPGAPAASSVYGGSVYKVRRGDNLSTLAKRFGTSVSQLKKMNGLRGTTLYIGQRLRVTAERPHVSKVAAKDRPSIYSVRRGDSLYVIGRRYGMSISELMRLNGLTSSKIKVGQKLRLRGSGVITSSKKSTTRVYKVRRGDSLWKIGRRFGVSITALKKANNMRSGVVKIGQKLKIP